MSEASYILRVIKMPLSEVINLRFSLSGHQFDIYRKIWQIFFLIQIPWTLEKIAILDGI